MATFNWACNHCAMLLNWIVGDLRPGQVRSRSSRPAHAMARWRATSVSAFPSGRPVFKLVISVDFQPPQALPCALAKTSEDAMWGQLQPYGDYPAPGAAPAPYAPGKLHNARLTRAIGVACRCS